MNYSELLFYRIDHWARLFKAKTWEELKMAAKNDQYLREACEAAIPLQIRAHPPEVLREH
jgi:hypothetical protein